MAKGNYVRRRRRATPCARNDRRSAIWHVGAVPNRPVHPLRCRGLNLPPAEGVTRTSNREAEIESDAARDDDIRPCSAVTHLARGRMRLPRLPSRLYKYVDQRALRLVSTSTTLAFPRVLIRGVWHNRGNAGAHVSHHRYACPSSHVCLHNLTNFPPRGRAERGVRATMALQRHADRLCNVPVDPGHLGVRRRGGTSTHGFPRRSAAAPQRCVRQPRGEVYAKGGEAARGTGRICDKRRGRSRAPACVFV